MKANLKYLIARCAVIGLFVIVTMLQIFSFPGQFAHMRRVQSIDLVVEILLTILVGVWMLLGQIGLVALWKLLRFAQEKQFFSPSAMRWLNLLCRVARGAAGVPALLFLVIAPRADDPGILVMLTAVTLFLVTIAIFLAILKEQISMKSEDRVG